MSYLPRNADLVVKTRECRGVLRHRLGKEFQGDGLAQAQIAGTVDFAHAPLTEASENPVALGQHGARQEPAFVEIGRAGGRLAATCLGHGECRGTGGKSSDRDGYWFAAGEAIAAIRGNFGGASGTRQHPQTV